MAIRIRVRDNCMLRTIRGKVGHIVEETTFNANHWKGYVVKLDGDEQTVLRTWKLYADEVEVIENQNSVDPWDNDALFDF